MLTDLTQVVLLESSEIPKEQWKQEWDIIKKEILSSDDKKYMCMSVVTIYCQEHENIDLFYSNM